MEELQEAQATRAARARADQAAAIGNHQGRLVCLLALCAAYHRCLQELQGKLDGSKEEIKELQSQEEDILGGSLRLVWSVWRLQDLRGQLKSQQELQGEVQDGWLLSLWTRACPHFFPSWRRRSR